MVPHVKAGYSTEEKVSVDYSFNQYMLLRARYLLGAVLDTEQWTKRPWRPCSHMVYILVRGERLQISKQNFSDGNRYKEINKATG